MKKFIEKLIGRLEDGIFSMDERMKYDIKTQKHLISQNQGIRYAINSINELAEEYKPNTNDAWKIVYDKVCNLEKEYAQKNNMESVNDCIRLENLLQYFKEELHCSEEHEHFRAMTNADKIRAMNDEELAELFTKLAWNNEVQTTPLKYLDWLQSEAE